LDAKVDISKLQFLNDRIAQVTDALNQVRLSVHGLQQQPQLGFPQPQFPQPQMGYQPPPFGFQHSPYAGLPSVSPFGQLPWQTGSQSPMGGGLGLQYGAYGPQAQQYMPQSIQGLGQGGWGGPASWFPSFGGGLYHSPTELIEQRLSEQRANDPNRILQTFPLCLAPISSTLW